MPEVRIKGYEQAMALFQLMFFNVMHLFTRVFFIAVVNDFACLHSVSNNE